MTVSEVGREKLPYLDPARTVDERVDDLLGRLTLEEKVAQLGSRWVWELADDRGRLRPEANVLLRDGLGQVTRVAGASGLGPEQVAELANTLQRTLVEETRLGIPAIVHEEICSGLMARDATVFPQAIGLASTWEPALLEELADAVRTQMRATGAHQGLGPVLDVCRDPRWGRLEETFGEDPYLVARMGVAFVRGLQGTEPTSGVIATAKHLVGYGASEGGRNWAPAQIPPRELHDVYLHPFEAVVRDAGVRSVMNAYNEIDGVPCAADHELLTALLREEWGFDGCVVSDYFSVRQLADYHRFALDAADAAAQALEAGLDVELPSTDCYGTPLLDAVRGGVVSEATVDTAVRRVLRSKFQLGLFEQPYVQIGRGSRDEQHAGAAQARPHDGAQEPRPPPERRHPAARGRGPLRGRDRPVRRGCPQPVRRLRVPRARRVAAGAARQRRRSVRARDTRRAAAPAFDVGAPTVLDALRARLGSRVRYARGCEVEGRARDGFAEAVALAREADVAVLVVGDKSGLTDDCTSGETRDRASLDLPGVQQELVRAVLETGTPVVLVLVAGRPYGGAALHEGCAAVLLSWLPGQEGADAIADALVGEFSPGGKLPVSYPRSSGQLPVFYGHKISGGRSHWKVDYADEPTAPLYPFGHGLSYTTFELRDAAVRRAEVSWSETVTVDVTVANTGDRDGDEVVQLYVHDTAASVTRPVLELKSFARVALPAGGSATVAFEIPVGQLGFHGRDLEFVVEPGSFEFLVGTSSADVVSAGSVTVVADASSAAPAKAFDGWVTVT